MCETPDPFPNSEAKAQTLMIVRERESKSLPTFYKAFQGNLRGLDRFKGMGIIFSPDVHCQVYSVIYILSICKI